MKIILSIFIGISITAQAAPWTNKDGKTIEADFVKLEANSLHLKMGVKQFKVPLDQLSPDSQGFAKFLHEKRKEWVAANASSPIISEQILQELAEYAPDAIEGKIYLVEGYVKEVSKSGGAMARAGGTKVDLEMTMGTKGEIDFAGTVDNKQRKLEVQDGKAICMVANTIGGRSGYSDYGPEKILLQQGQEIVVRAMVNRGKIKATGLASTAEITKARLEYAKQSGGVSLEDAVALEEIKNRIDFLELQLKGNAGTASIDSHYGNVGSITFEYSEAQKTAMRKELELLKAQLSAATK